MLARVFWFYNYFARTYSNNSVDWVQKGISFFSFYLFTRNKFFRITFASSLRAGKEVTVNVDSFFTHALKPYPTQIAQAEKQYVQFFGNAYFFSPYKTKTQTTTINCASSTIESYTKTVKPVSQTDSSISYGPFENKEPFSQVCIYFLMEKISF